MQLKKCLSTLVFTVLIFQILFFLSGYAATYFDISILTIGLWLNVSYSLSITLVGLYFLLTPNSIFNKPFIPAVIGSMLMSYFAPGVSAVFLSVLAVGSITCQGIEKAKPLEDHLISKYSE